MSGEEVRFGRFRFDLGRRELWRDGVPVRLGSRALDVLSVLVAARGDVVTKDELLARVWPGLVVEENNLQVQVSALRKALDENKSGQSYLVTVPGRGYRLIGIAGGSHGPALPDKMKRAFSAAPVVVNAGIVSASQRAVPQVSFAHRQIPGNSSLDPIFDLAVSRNRNRWRASCADSRPAE